MIIGGHRYKLHLRESSNRTYCGRVKSKMREHDGSGLELWDNGTQIIATTDRLKAVTCSRCLT